MKRQVYPSHQPIVTGSSPITSASLPVNQPTSPNWPGSWCQSWKKGQPSSPHPSTRASLSMKCTMLSSTLKQAVLRVWMASRRSSYSGCPSRPSWHFVLFSTPASPTTRFPLAGYTEKSSPSLSLGGMNTTSPPTGP
eukprot:Lithocolla_globosa_v1_NODE_3036_length_1785_cov_11.864740.p3 type:complete len:137 gc:universal NODE_3036_length_1785_cov_11.864740:769-1179(+)